ncbi:MAG: hypothetical protein R2830_07825 [Saprospiraceae bacterium]
MQPAPLRLFIRDKFNFGTKATLIQVENDFVLMVKVGKVPVANRQGQCHFQLEDHGQAGNEINLKRWIEKVRISS